MIQGVDYTGGRRAEKPNCNRQETQRLATVGSHLHWESGGTKRTGPGVYLGNLEPQQRGAGLPARRGERRGDAGGNAAPGDKDGDGGVTPCLLPLPVSLLKCLPLAE